jgi:hypothetical protein
VVLRHCAGQLVHRRDEEEDVEQERDERPDGDAAGRDTQAAHAEDGDERHLDSQAGRVPRDRTPCRGVDTGPPRLRRSVIQPLCLAVLGTGRFDGPERAEHPLKRRPHDADRLLGAPRRPVDARHDQRDDGDGQPERGQRHGEHHQVQQCHQCDRGDEGQQAGDSADQGSDSYLAQECCVRGHPGHEVAGLVPLHRREAQPEQSGEQAPPSGEDHGLGGAAQDVAAESTDRGVGNDERCHERDEPGHRLVGAEIFDELAHHERQGQTTGRRGQAEQAAEDQHAPMRTGVRHQDPPRRHPGLRAVGVRPCAHPVSLSRRA